MPSGVRPNAHRLSHAGVPEDMMPQSLKTSE